MILFIAVEKLPDFGKVKIMESIKSHRKNDWRLNEQLQRIFIKKSFKKDLLKYRNEIGIPKNGFKSNGEFIKWLEDDRMKYNTIRVASIETAKKFKLSFIHTFYIEARLLLGKRYKQFPKKPPFEAYSRGFENPDSLCAWDVDSGTQSVIIQVFAGATARDVKRFVDQNFRKMKNILNTFEMRVKPIRDSGKTERNKQILQLRKDGLINSLGLPSSIENREKIPEPIIKMDSDTRRSVIKKEKRMRR